MQGLAFLGCALWLLAAVWMSAAEDASNKLVGVLCWILYVASAGLGLASCIYGLCRPVDHNYIVYVWCSVHIAGNALMLVLALGLATASTPIPSDLVIPPPQSPVWQGLRVAKDNKGPGPRAS